MIVVDASVVLDVLLRTDSGRRVEERVVGAEPVGAPHLLDLEVAQVLRRHVASGGLDPTRARAALQDFADMRIRRYPHTVLLGRIWSLRDNATAYDGAYLALAEALEAPLLTSDRTLAGVPGFAAVVEVVG